MTAIDLGMIGGTGPDFVRRHCRNTDPATSQKAAERAQKFATGHCRLVLASIALHGPQTPKEISATTGLTSVQISRRTRTLQNAGLIRETGLERDDCRVLEAVQ